MVARSVGGGVANPTQNSERKQHLSVTPDPNSPLLVDFPVTPLPTAKKIPRNFSLCLEILKNAMEFETIIWETTPAPPLSYGPQLSMMTTAELETVQGEERELSVTDEISKQL